MADKNAYDKKYLSLTGCAPFSNAVKQQFGTKTLTLMVQDSGAISSVITMIGNSHI